MNAQLEKLRQALLAIRTDMVAASALSQQLDTIHPHYRDSAQNLLHYLALRRHDLRPLQLELASLGLSSLGRTESHVLATIDAVLEVLHHLTGVDHWAPAEKTTLHFIDGQRLIAEHTEALLGAPPRDRNVRIMVTMPTAAGDHYALVHDLLQQGMDCMRINCAHDNPGQWQRMIEHLRRAEQSLGRTCRIVMDLAGPKLRTGPLEPGPSVAHIRPQRNIYGQITAPARLWLTSEETPHAPPTSADACLPVPANWLTSLHVGERIKFTDARNAKRALTIVDVTPYGCWAEATQTLYITNGTVLRRNRNTAAKQVPLKALISQLPPLENALLLYPGDQLILTRHLQPGRAAILDSAGEILTPATIGCTICEVFDDVHPGEAIWFDDGKIGGIIEKVNVHEVLIRITQTRFQGGAKLRADKGINLPDSLLKLPALTAKDIADLAFIAQHADVVELSFANTAHDVESLQQHLARLSKHPPAIVLKIETRQGFEHLPEMLLTAMRSPCCGIMIARGDLAVECGFERLAEIQEEILWICEAAHVPVIWATQVLETLAKKGMPSRAEITDAAMGHRAECVMLNKGPHMLSAVRVLDDILKRMQTHQTKKRAMLRELHLAHSLSGINTSSF